MIRNLIHRGVGEEGKDGLLVKGDRKEMFCIFNFNAVLLHRCQRYLTLSSDSLRVYNKHTKAAWGDVPLELKAVISLDDVVSILTSSKRLKNEGKSCKELITFFCGRNYAVAVKIYNVGTCLLRGLYVITFP